MVWNLDGDECWVPEANSKNESCGIIEAHEQLTRIAVVIGMK